MLFDKSKYATKKELFKFLVDNKEQLITQKKSITKEADGISVNSLPGASFVGKAIETDKKEISVKAVINTTNVMDSHDDVHIQGLWDKSLRENKRIMHVQEHKSSEFDKIIASGPDLKAYTQTYTFKELGFDLEGSTDALVFDSNVKESRNKYMFDAYKNGYVNNHSVGMRYVKMAMCINDEDYPTEKEAWDKYISQVANKDEAEANGYFWAVTEAKVMEGSAVPMGSNSITPTLEVKQEPAQATHDIEPLIDSTLSKSDIINLFKTFS